MRIEIIKEETLHKQICDYIKLQYRDVIFNTDMSGIRLTMGQAIKAKKLRSGQGFPDIVIYERSSEYNALFLEVKKASPYRKDGELYKDKHLKEQDRMHRRLRLRRYKAEFVWSFEQAKEIIDNYLKEREW